MSLPEMHQPRNSSPNPNPNPNPSEWLDYNKTNRRDPKMAQVWVEPLVRWLLEPAPKGLGLKPGAKVLDFGCGYLDAGIGLRQRAETVDGFDIDPYACQMAEHMLKTHGVAGRVYRRSEDIPRGHYDLIIVNSVMQYFGDTQQAQEHLFQIAQSLAAGGQLVMADLIPPDYSPFVDALNSLLVGVRKQCFGAMVRHLWHALHKKSELTLLRFDLKTVAMIVKELGPGLEMEHLKHNLTPSPFRYSVVIRQGSVQR